MSRSERDEHLARKVVELGLTTPERVRECLDVQKRMSDMGVQDSLAALLVKKGLITQAQLVEALKALGVDVQPVPGYRILDRIGRGGTGEVYKARQESMDRLVALKILSGRATESQSFVERFLKEAQAAAKLNHRAIIQAYDAGCANGLYYFAMELVDGVSVHDLVKRDGPFAEERALEIALQVCDALATIQRHRMIHRDVKPENILLTGSDEVKICDFGLAKREEAADVASRRGYTVGSPYYMSPEQVTGRKDLDIRTDLYSLGASLYFMLTGRQVFQGPDAKSVMAQHLSAEPCPPSRFAAGVTRGTDEIVLRLLAKEREARYSAPEQVAEDVRRVRAGSAPSFAGSRRRRTIAIASASAAGVVVVLAVAVVLSVLSGPDPDPDPGTDPVQGPAPTPNAETAALPVIAAPPPPPSQPDVEAAPIAPPPAMPDGREVRAEGAFMRAELAFQGLADRAARGEDSAEDWRRLERQYKEFEVEFASTRFFNERRREVWDRTAACREGFARADLRVRNDQEASHDKLRGVFEEGRQRMAAKEWVRAAETFRGLLGLKLPADLSAREIERLAEECLREGSAEALWSHIRQLQASARWNELLQALSDMERKFKGTVTLADRVEEIARARSVCQAERAAEAAIASVRQAVAAQDWKAAQEALRGIEAHGDTAAARRAGEELERHRATVAARIREPLERRAQEAWQELIVHAEAKDYKAAAQALRGLEAPELADTRFLAGVRDELARRKEEIAAGLAKLLEDEARDMLATARRLQRENKPEDALPIYELLLKDPQLSGTSIVDRSRRTIERDHRRIAEDVEQLQAALIEGFEHGIGGWESLGDKLRGKIDLVDDAYSGTKALRISFRPQDKGWAHVQGPACEAPQRAFGISFFAKSATSRVARIRVQFRLGRGDAEVVYRAERDVGTAWTEVRLTWADFRFFWSAQKQGQPQAFDPKEIRRVEFSQGSPEWEDSYIIDRLRWEAR